jgi:hypothetical protein
MCAVDEIRSNSVITLHNAQKGDLGIAKRHESRINASRTNFDHRCSLV